MDQAIVVAEHPPALNRGFGTEMMRQAADRCFADPAVTAIVIDPLNSNVAAHRFYRRHGFESVATLASLLRDGDDELLMRKRLAP